MGAGAGEIPRHYLHPHHFTCQVYTVRVRALHLQPRVAYTVYYSCDASQITSLAARSAAAAAINYSRSIDEMTETIERALITRHMSP